MKTLIKGGTIVNEGLTLAADILIDGDTIASITPLTATLPPLSSKAPTLPSPLSPLSSKDPTLTTIDATGCYVLPGVIDDHVHFREPGLTDKADISTESAAAAAGGVTTYFEMPNTVPQTTTLEALDHKFHLAAAKSHVNYSFFFGATAGGEQLIDRLDPSAVPGVKLFMGSSTGNMLVDQPQALDAIFAATAGRLPLMVHCEDTTIINRNLAAARQRYGDDPDVRHHPDIRSAEACYASTSTAVALARRHHAQLHVAHLSTARELELIPPYSPLTAHPLPLITAEATVSHLFFSSRDYPLLGTRIKCNPAVKTEADRDALQAALTDGHIAVVATDHAPHLLSQKVGGCVRAASGMPMVQFSLVTMLSLVDRGVLTIGRLVDLMCHNPARIFGVSRRGFLRPGYFADIVLVRPTTAWTVTSAAVLSKCGWSPLEGHTFRWRVQRTLCNGHTVYDGNTVDTAYTAQRVTFQHP